MSSRLKRTKLNLSAGGAGRAGGKGCVESTNLPRFFSPFLALALTSHEHPQRYGPRSDSDPLLPAEIEATHFPASSSSHHEATDSTSTSSVQGHLSHNSSAAAFHLRSTAPPAQPPVTLEASPLTYHSLGSRFLPHLPSIPLCALPILAGRFLLLGTANGLYALDPSRLDRDEGGARCIWEGLGVQEMKEVGVEKDDQGGTKTPQAAVVMLTCPAKNDDDGGGEIVGNVEGGEVRVWQAASLVSLACWVLDTKVGRNDLILVLCVAGSIRPACLFIPGCPGTSQPVRVSSVKHTLNRWRKFPLAAPCGPSLLPRSSPPIHPLGGRPNTSLKRQATTNALCFLGFLVPVPFDPYHG